ncbi:FAD-binding and (Fe-S)-binding domain-containing protein [Gracilimonas mengyeensis]|uniref:FAD/FMN-containing dehydrogenase n=1 Tax=Gracilimonas mengyeensis TaxID=1302730 RepID=A0A521FAZ2_9BACT|nr:FAD-binding and (Fe-S)-binding domain-containing protein [Gracilimonas mengyeensis]SMO93306.1 FAD/FMN-containing dehydrogenase [Gracilimonas mengyeensis]
MIQRDSLTRHLYATDASMYQEVPEGVAFPKTSEDIQQLVRQANTHRFSITARSAGTSLAGQTTGGGVIMDVSRYMTQILEMNEKEQFALVEPGVIRDILNREAGKHQLLFGPDTATTNRCMMGGMIGNNSAGSFSIKYQTTREHVREMEVVLSDGSRATFKPLTPRELEAKKKLDNLEGHIYRSMLKLLERHRELIETSYPHKEIIRRNTGYALDKLLEMQPFRADGRPFNLCELLCGSEGTLAMTVSAKLNLVPKDPHQLLIIPQFKTLEEAMRAAVEIVKYDPAAVELVDHIILDATKGNIEQRKNRFFLDGEPRYILITQFEGQDVAKLHQRAEELRQRLSGLNLGYAYPVVDESDKMKRVWDLRKAGLGLLMGLGEDTRSPSFCEDTAVRVQDLPEYVQEFQQILEKHDTGCVFYAHASVGELHLRPVLDITTPAGLEKMKTIAGEIADLVKKYRGSLSGEHGDGRARAPYIPKVLGEEMMPVLKQVKEIWDPEYIFNPGKIVNPKPMEADLRFSPEYKKPAPETVFSWEKEGSFGEATELCNGAGVCRKLAKSGGTMCPSYMATKEEKDTTRGRANVFRQVFEGDHPDGFASEELREALDLCLSCKACKSECPANVDMAKMKAEFMHGWHEQNGSSLKERFFAEAGKLYPLASITPKLANAITASAPVKWGLEQVFGIDQRRDLPAFAPRSFGSLFKAHQRKGTVQSPEKVVLFVDLFSWYNEPDVAMAAVHTLETMGYEVIISKHKETGRPQLSKGFLKDAQQIVREVLDDFRDYVEAGIPVVGLEPSEILTLRDEFLELCRKDQKELARKLALQSFMFEEFVADHADKLPGSNQKQKVLLHGHCHAKALVGNQPTVEALEAAGYEVEELQTGCCGMAGSFGYEKEHYEVSQDIGELVLFPALREKKEELVCAPGFSCRHQIKDEVSRKAWHPAELIAQRIRGLVD